MNRHFSIPVSPRAKESWAAADEEEEEESASGLLPSAPTHPLSLLALPAPQILKA